MKSTRPECDMFCHSMTVSVLCITGRRHSTTFRLAFYSNAGCYYIREAMFMLFILFYFLFLHIFFLLFSSFPWRRRRPYRILRGSIGRACLARATMHVTVCHENIMDRLHIAPRIGHPCTCSIYNVWYYFLYISYRHTYMLMYTDICKQHLTVLLLLDCAAHHTGHGSHSVA